MIARRSVEVVSAALWFVGRGLACSHGPIGELARRSAQRRRPGGSVGVKGERQQDAVVGSVGHFDVAVVLVVGRGREGHVVCGCGGQRSNGPTRRFVRTSSHHVGNSGGRVAPAIGVGCRVAPSRMRRSGGDICRGRLREDIGRRVNVRSEGGSLVVYLARQGGQRLVHFGRGGCRRFFGFLAPASHERLVARHAEDALRGAGIAQVLNLALAVAAAEAVGAEGLVARQNGQVLDLVAAVVAAVCAVVAYQRAVAEQQQVCVRVEKGAARVAAEAVDVPSVPRCSMSVCHSTAGASGHGRAGARGAWCLAEKCIPSSNAFPSSRIWAAVSDCARCWIGPVLPLRIPCTDTRHRPGRSATLGRLLASPCCLRPAGACAERASAHASELAG